MEYKDILHKTAGTLFFRILCSYCSDISVLESTQG
jgi:hypothetical protein